MRRHNRCAESRSTCSLASQCRHSLSGQTGWCWLSTNMSIQRYSLCRGFNAFAKSLKSIWREYTMYLMPPHNG
jgi:hypothetical protein